MWNLHPNVALSWTAFPPEIWTQLPLFLHLTVVECLHYTIKIGKYVRKWYEMAVTLGKSVRRHSIVNWWRKECQKMYIRPFCNVESEPLSRSQTANTQRTTKNIILFKAKLIQEHFHSSLLIPHASEIVLWNQRKKKKKNGKNDTNNSHICTFDGRLSNCNVLIVFARHSMLLPVMSICGIQFSAFFHISTIIHAFFHSNHTYI